MEAFSVKITNLMAKFDRVENIYKTKVPDTPQIVYDTFQQTRKRLKEAQSRHGDVICPFDLVEK